MNNNVVLEWLHDFFVSLLSALIALARLVFLTLSLFVTGVQIVLFTRTEICNIEMRGQAWRCDKEKLADTLSFVDKIALENPELFEMTDNELPEDFSDGKDEDE